MKAPDKSRGPFAAWEGYSVDGVEFLWLVLATPKGVHVEVIERPLLDVIETRRMSEAMVSAAEYHERTITIGAGEANERKADLSS